MADRKLVRLRSVTSGAVVQTTEENAARLPGFEPAEAEQKPRRRKASEADTSSDDK